jgi:hypothetical protein
MFIDFLSILFAEYFSIFVGFVEPKLVDANRAPANLPCECARRLNEGDAKR